MAPPGRLEFRRGGVSISDGRGWPSFGEDVGAADNCVGAGKTYYGVVISRAGAHVVGRWETQDDFEESYRQAKAMLERHPDSSGLYSIGSGVRGIAHALTERGMAREVVNIGHDLTRFTRQFLIDGTVDAIIHQNPERQARLAVETLIGHYDGTARHPPDLLNVEVFLRENLP